MDINPGEERVAMAPAQSRPNVLLLWLLAPLLVVAGSVAAFVWGLPPGDPSAPAVGELELIWGRRGVSEGRFHKPRAIAIDRESDLIYTVDMKARIQLFDLDGKFLRGWQTPEFEHGRPSGLTIARDGNLLVADTHYYRVLVYTPQGELLSDRTIGGTRGHGPGEFGFVTDAVEDSQGNYYVAEYGEYDRIQKFSPSGEFLFQWGGHGPEPGKFIRPQNLTVDEHDHIWVADACNHRIQVFDATGNQAKLVKIWGELGDAPGQLNYPYDLVLDGKGHVYVIEYGNNRVQKFTTGGKSLGCWGTSGRQKGQLHNPWALDIDSQGRIHVLDSNNHRVQRIRL